MFDFVPTEMQQNKFITVCCPSPRSLFAQYGLLSPVTADYSGDTAVSSFRSKLSLTDELTENF